MKLFSRVALITTLIASPVICAQAADASIALTHTNEPIVQQLKLSNAQVAKIRKLHNQLISSLQKVPVKDIKQGALFSVIESGKWDDAAVKSQLSAYGNMDQQVRYYKVKYYFDVAQVLTPEQREQVINDLAQAATE